MQQKFESRSYREILFINSAVSYLFTHAYIGHSHIIEMIIRDSPGLESRDWTDFVRDSNPGIQLWIPGFRDFEIQ